jgi:hypothetical protein
MKNLLAFLALVLILVSCGGNKDNRAINEYLSAFLKDNKKVIFCKSNVTIFNNYFGHYFFEEGKTYNFYFKNKLGNDFKNIDDYWFFKKRLDEMMAQEEIPTNEMAIKKIIALI